MIFLKHIRRERYEGIILKEGEIFLKSIEAPKTEKNSKNKLATFLMP